MITVKRWWWNQGDRKLGILWEKVFFLVGNFLLAGAWLVLSQPNQGFHLDLFFKNKNIFNFTWLIVQNTFSAIKMLPFSDRKIDFWSNQIFWNACPKPVNGEANIVSVKAGKRGEKRFIHSAYKSYVNKTKTFFQERTWRTGTETKVWWRRFLGHPAA